MVWEKPRSVPGSDHLVQCIGPMIEQSLSMSGVDSLLECIGPKMAESFSMSGVDYLVECVGPMMEKSLSSLVIDYLWRHLELLMWLMKCRTHFADRTLLSPSRLLHSEDATETFVHR